MNFDFSEIKALANYKFSKSSVSCGKSGLNGVFTQPGPEAADRDLRQLFCNQGVSGRDADVGQMAGMTQGGRLPAFQITGNQSAMQLRAASFTILVQKHC